MIWYYQIEYSREEPKSDCDLKWDCTMKLSQWSAVSVIRTALVGIYSFFTFSFSMPATVH